MIRFLTIMLLFIWVTGHSALYAQIEKGGIQHIIQLPQPNKQVKMTLFEALQTRKSSRVFADKKLESTLLSQLLWAASGINRPDSKKLTAPSAMNRQSVSIYVCMENGAYLWKNSENILLKVCEEDVRPLVTNGQQGIGNYPLALVMVADNAKFDHKAINEALPIVLLDAAIVSQNINLAATALHLNNVPRVNMNMRALKEKLKLTPTQFPIMNNLVGYGL